MYLGGSLALASFELLVHLRAPDVLQGYRKLPVRIPEELIRGLDVRGLPPEWAAPALHAHTQEVGDRWLESEESAVLRVPSAVVPGEVNYVANPKHPDFDRIEPGTISGFRYDPRVLKSVSPAPSDLSTPSGSRRASE